MHSPSKPTFVYLGTPEFAIPALKALLANADWHVAAVITRPDKPAGRGQKLQAPPVKDFAQENEIPVFQPASLKDIKLCYTGNKETTKAKCLSTTNAENTSLVEFLNSLPRLDAFISVAYGRIIPASLINFPSIGVINIHPSLLPRWRGAAPIQHTIFSGDAETGISIMLIDEGLDTGPVFCQKIVALKGNESFGSLHALLAELGAKVLVEALPDILSGKLTAKTQESEGATYAAKWDKEDTVINWQDSADIIARRIRASSPEPGGRTFFCETLLKVLKGHVVDNQNYLPASPGTIVESNAGELVVASGDGQYLSIDEMQFPGRRCLPIREIVKGYKFNIGDKFD